MIPIQRIIDSVSQEITSKEGSDRFNIERSPTNLRQLLQQCLITLAQDTKQFLSHVGLTLSDALVPSATTGLSASWSPLNDSIYEDVEYHRLTHPERYLDMRQMLIGGYPASEVDLQDTDSNFILPVYLTMPNGWIVAAYNSATGQYIKVENNTKVHLSYYTYPDIMGQELLQAHPLSELALVHLMLYHLQSRDPFIQTSGDQLRPMQFNNASWQYEQYQNIAIRILDLTGQSTIKSITNIKPHYL